jgi:hypothetical protein
MDRQSDSANAIAYFPQCLGDILFRADQGNVVDVPKILDVGSSRELLIQGVQDEIGDQVTKHWTGKNAGLVAGGQSMIVKQPLTECLPSGFQLSPVRDLPPCFLRHAYRNRRVELLQVDVLNYPVWRFIACLCNRIVSIAESLAVVLVDPGPIIAGVQRIAKDATGDYKRLWIPCTLSQQRGLSQSFICSRQKHLAVVNRLPL